MTIIYLKQASRKPALGDPELRSRVETMLAEFEVGGEVAVAKASRDLDGWAGEIEVSAEARRVTHALVPAELRRDIDFAQANVKRFAEAQLAALGEMEVEVFPGLRAGHRNIPIETAGCYVPGGRYSHIASAIMSVTTAKVAGVANIIACSPPRGGEGIPPAVLYALDICGAHRILTLGGVQGVAALAFGYFTGYKADILVGPGNQYVVEAKRQLYGRLAIDMLAGPTESMVIADHTADPEIVAWDLVGQAEHGSDSPVCLVSLDRTLAESVFALVPALLDRLPEPNRTNARKSWENHAEVSVAATREEAAALSDAYACEHLQVQCADLDWWLNRLRNYGSLFLGEETTVAFGDKVSGPNHILPTAAAARYTGGLSVGKFLKTVTWQRMSRMATAEVAPVCARISRHEGMEGHARSADIRLHKWGPDGTRANPLKAPDQVSDQPTMPHP
ncbi:MAG: histidinol dehydrogenase [Hyphomicrobiales bacterium]|nr:histidinol dehydrogenase [Hyphomicrobiales bacterium]